VKFISIRLPSPKKKEALLPGRTSFFILKTAVPVFGRIFLLGVLGCDFGAALQFIVSIFKNFL